MKTDLFIPLTSLFLQLFYDNDSCVHTLTSIHSSVPSGSWPGSSHSGLRGSLSDGPWTGRHEQESSLLIGLPYPSDPSTTVLLPPHHLPLPHNTQQLQLQQQYHHYRSSDLPYSGYSSTVTRDLLGIPVFTASSTPSTSSSDEASEGICADYGGSSSQGDEKVRQSVID